MEDWKIKSSPNILKENNEEEIRPYAFYSNRAQYLETIIVKPMDIDIRLCD